MARQRFGRWDKYWKMLGQLTKTSVNPKDRSDSICNIKNPASTRQSEIERMDAFEAEQKRSKPLPAAEIMLILPIVLCFVDARAYLIVEPLTGLRALPLQAFETFELTQFLPHW